MTDDACCSLRKYLEERALPQATSITVRATALERAGYSDIRPSSVKGEHFYRLFAGKYSSLRAAESAEKNFTEHGYPASFVLSPG